MSDDKAFDSNAENAVNRIEVLEKEVAQLKKQMDIVILYGCEHFHKKFK